VEQKLFSTIKNLVLDEDGANKMQEEIKKFARIDADELIAKEIINKIENANNN
jgi:hypothetical protein